MQEDLYKTILETVEDGVYFVDRERRITFWNAGAENITGYSADDVLDHSCSEGILRHVSEGGDQLCLHGCPLSGVMSDGRSRSASVYLHHKNGHRVPVTVKARPLYDSEGEIAGSIEVFTRRKATRFADITDRERREDALIDPLTDLGNRRYGEAHMLPMMAAVTSGVSTLGLVFIDVDEFKKINDTRGHKVGDAVLRMVAQTLANGLRTTDMVVRWGGEEFLAALPGMKASALLSAAERLRMLVDHSWLQVDDEQVRATISAGAVLVSPDETLEQAIERADRLMYASKHAGRNLVTGEEGPVPRLRPSQPLLHVGATTAAG